MNACQIIRDVEAVGGNFLLHDGGLRLAGKTGAIKPFLLAEVKSHKAEIIGILYSRHIKERVIDENTVMFAEQKCNVNGGFTEVEFNQPELSPVIDSLHPCPLCGRDLAKEGIGDCYHRTGEVPYPEPVIDGLHPCSQCGGEFFYEGTRGGYFCKRCQVLPEGSEPVQVVRGITPRGKGALRGDAPNWITPAMYQRQTTRARDKRRISPVALQWLREHRQELKAAGWTARELYRRNKAEGICWSGIWDKPLCKAYLLEKGVIEFEFVDGGREVIQTARPENFWRKK